MGSKDFEGISLSNSLDFNFLKANAIKLNWDLVSQNRQIVWSKEIIEEFRDHLNWCYLIENDSINWKNTDLLSLALGCDDWRMVFSKSKLNWNKEDYYKLKIDERLHDYWIPIQTEFLELDIDWSVKEFIFEYDGFRESCGPFIDQRYNSHTGEITEDKSYHSDFIYERYLKCLDKVFEKFWKRNIYSEEVLINRISNFDYSICEGYIGHFYSRKNWEYLSKSLIIPWSVNLIKTFSPYWHWKKLLNNESICWTKRTIEEFAIYIDNFTWEDDYYEHKKVNAWNGLLLNPNLKIDLEYLTSSDFLFDWDLLALNEHFNFSSDVLEYIHDELCVLISHEESSHNAKFRNSFFRNLSKNISVKWTYEILRKYKHLLEWNETSIVYSNGWIIKKLSHLENFYFTGNFINEFSDVLDFDFLSSCVNVEWSKEILFKYMHLWNWKKLKKNNSVIWDNAFDNIYEQYQLENNSKELKA